MNKEIFESAINALKAQYEHDNKCLEAFRVIFPNDYVTGYNNYLLEDALVSMLVNLTNDENGWIEYFIYELEWGTKYHECSVTEDGVPVPLATIDDLWNILNQQDDII